MATSNSNPIYTTLTDVTRKRLLRVGGRPSVSYRRAFP